MSRIYVADILYLCVGAALADDLLYQSERKAFGVLHAGQGRFGFLFPRHGYRIKMSAFTAVIKGHGHIRE